MTKCVTLMCVCPTPVCHVRCNMAYCVYTLSGRRCKLTVDAPRQAIYWHCTQLGHTILIALVYNIDIVLALIARLNSLSRDQAPADGAAAVSLELWWLSFGAACYLRYYHARQLCWEAGICIVCMSVQAKRQQEANVIWQRLHRMRYACTHRSVQLQLFRRCEEVSKFKTRSPW